MTWATRLPSHRPIARSLLLAGLALGLIALPAGALAQGLSGSTSNTTGSTCAGGNNSDGFCGFSSSVLTNTSTTFQSRHAWNVNADTGVGSTRDESSSNVQHNVSFNATAPGSYQVSITTARNGMLQRNSDIV